MSTESTPGAPAPRPVRKSLLGKVLLSGAIVLAAACGLGVESHVSGTNAETARMTAIADQLQTDTGWGHHGEYVGYRGYVCSPDSGCAELQRKWMPVPGLTGVDLQARIDAAGWDLVLDDDCIRKPDDSGQKSLCNAQGFVQGYEVWVSVVSESSYRPEPILILNIF